MTVKTQNISMRNDITELFVFIDDFCKAIDKHEAESKITDDKHRNPTRKPALTISEILTIVILFQQSPCKNFKYFFTSYLQLYRAEFPRLGSYNRFVELMPRCLSYMYILLNWFFGLTNPKGLHFIDSSKIAVCHNKRISSHKVFAGLAKRGKSSMGWFYGFKLHLVINHKGEIQGAMLTPGNVDDRVPVEKLTSRLTGLLFGDKGYIKKELFHKLFQKGLKLVTNVKGNMKNKLVPLAEKMMLRKRSIIETVFDVLKNTFQLQHTRHRSPANFLVHIGSTLLAYCFRSKKPRVKFVSLIPN